MVGTGHVALLWAVQPSDHSLTCGQRLTVSPVFRFDHSSVWVCGSGVPNHVHFCLSCESFMLLSDKQSSRKLPLMHRCESPIPQEGGERCLSVGMS